MLGCRLPPLRIGNLRINWPFGAPAREANYYTGTTDPASNRTPQQVGEENDWAACASSPGQFYHLLLKKDGSLWALDASEHRHIKPPTQYRPIKLVRIPLRKDVAGFAAGADDFGVVLARDGEVWTWGKVMGEHTAKDYDGPHGKQYFPQLRVIAEPWQVSHED